MGILQKSQSPTAPSSKKPSQLPPRDPSLTAIPIHQGPTRTCSLFIPKKVGRVNDKGLNKTQTPSHGERSLREHPQREDRKKMELGGRVRQDIKIPGRLPKGGATCASWKPCEHMCG